MSRRRSARVASVGRAGTGRAARRARPGFPWGLAIVAGFAALGLGVAIAQLAAPRAPQAAVSAGLVLGAPAPAIALPATTGGAVSLDQFRGTKVVVYFYEGGG